MALGLKSALGIDYHPVAVEAEAWGKVGWVGWEAELESASPVPAKKAGTPRPRGAQPMDRALVLSTICVPRS